MASLHPTPNGARRCFCHRGVSDGLSVCAGKTKKKEKEMLSRVRLRVTAAALSLTSASASASRTSMEHHTPSPSIASLLNPIQPYHSPPSRKKTTEQPPKRKRSKQPSPPLPASATHNHNDLNHSILFNPHPSLSMLTLAPSHNNNSFISHPNSTSSPRHSSSSSPSSSNTKPSLPATTVQTNLEHSIFGIAPYDQFTWTIAQFIWQHARQYWESGQAHLVEIEAKLGTIRDKRPTGERMYYPIGTESPILDTRDTKFQSDMSVQQHETLNRLLNQRVTESNSSGYLGSRVDYLHLKQIDEFFDSQVRVSRNWKGGKGSNINIDQAVPRSIVKEKIAHLDVHCPGRPFDFRISVNVEQPVPLPHQSMTPKFQRIKDRLSYSHQICQIDLTQVKSSDMNVSSTHEVEVEFKNSPELLKAASIWSETQEAKNTQAITTNKRPQRKGKRKIELEGLFGDEDEQEEGEGEKDEQVVESDHEQGEEDVEDFAGSNNTGNGFKKKNKKVTETQLVMDSNYYLLMVEVFLNNIRMLILNC